MHIPTKHACRTSIIRPIVSVLLIGVLVFLIFAFSKVLNSMEQYRRVYQSPLKVSGSISRHDTYTSDDDTDYYSYVEFTYEGTRYEVRYENENSETDLTPVGQLVQIEVSPEDPSKTIESLRSSNKSFFFASAYSCIILSCAYSFIVSLRRSQHLLSPSQEEICKDIILKLVGRKRNFLFLSLAISYWAVLQRYPMLFGEKTTIAAGVASILAFLCIGQTIRYCNMAHRGEFSLRLDTLTEKGITGEDENIYQLTYTSSEGGKTWHTTVSLERYNQASIGETVRAVYLNGVAKPILHYDLYGDAR